MDKRLNTILLLLNKLLPILSENLERFPTKDNVKNYTAYCGSLINMVNNMELTENIAVIITCIKHFTIALPELRKVLDFITKESGEINKKDNKTDNKKDSIKDNKSTKKTKGKTGGFMELRDNSKLIGGREYHLMIGGNEITGGNEVKSNLDIKIIAYNLLLSDYKSGAIDDDYYVNILLPRVRELFGLKGDIIEDINKALLSNNIAGLDLYRNLNSQIDLLMDKTKIINEYYKSRTNKTISLNSKDMNNIIVYLTTFLDDIHNYDITYIKKAIMNMEKFDYVGKFNDIINDIGLCFIRKKIKNNLTNLLNDIKTNFDKLTMIKANIVNQPYNQPQGNNDDRAKQILNLVNSLIEHQRGLSDNLQQQEELYDILASKLYGFITEMDILTSANYKRSCIKHPTNLIMVLSALHNKSGISEKSMLDRIYAVSTYNMPIITGNNWDDIINSIV